MKHHTLSSFVTNHNHAVDLASRACNAEQKRGSKIKFNELTPKENKLWNPPKKRANITKLY